MTYRMTVKYLPAADGTVELACGERILHQMSVRAAKRLAADILAALPDQEQEPVAGTLDRALRDRKLEVAT